MFQRLTDDSRRTIALSRECALRLGRNTIDCVSVVVGMFAEEDGAGARALATVGVNGKDFVAAVQAERPKTPPDMARRLQFAKDTRDALEAALRESQRLGHPMVTSGHLLLGVLAQGGPAVEALTGLDASPAQLRPVILAELEERVGKLSAQLTAVDLRSVPEGALPTRAATIGRTVSVLAAYTAAAVLAFLTVAPDSRDAVLIGYSAIVLLDSVVAVAAGRARRRVLVQRQLAGTSLVETPPAAAEAVATFGVTQLEFRSMPLPVVRNRSFRQGRDGWVVLSEATLVSAAATTFVTAHEVAHVARNDSARRRLAVVWIAGALGLALIAPGAGTFVAAVLATGVIFVGERWLAELGCDAVAVRWVGIGPMRAWAAFHHSLLTSDANQTPRRRSRRAFGWLTHPPLAVRLWWAARQLSTSDS